MGEHEDPIITQCRQRVGLMVSGKWRLDALIGVGGMAAVYMATHRNGSMAAVKILHDEVAMNEEVRERFLREAYIANKVGHDGTVKVLDDDTDENGTPYLVMELLQGRSVEAVAEDAGGRLTIDETLDILDQTLAVLESAHAQGIIHRDLKPENLFMTGSGQVKVLDFGIARLRENNARKTQTGMVMGTPSFMAPEQAMGRWDDVDHRTDLYAVGATAFTLLSGRPVHEAETAGEMLVAAATRPARSLARVLNTAPFNLVAMVDRALAYERDNRMPDATTFRREIAKLKGSLGDEEVSRTQVDPEVMVMPETVHGAKAADGYKRLKREERIDSFDPSENSPEEIDNMADLFVAVERALTARTQYGTEHPETKRRFTEAFKKAASALMTCDICLAWNLTPYAFIAAERVVWEPEPPWNRVPYQLFSDGVRTMGLVPGLEEEDFFKWLEIITLDPTTDLAPEDDMVTVLWDQDFEFVFYQAIDAFAEGSQEERARFEAQRAAVIDGAHVEQPAELARAWQDGHGQQQPSRAEQVLNYLTHSEPMDAESAARAANLNLKEVSPQEAQAAAALRVDDSTRALLSARLGIDVAATSERFVVAAAEAFVASAKMGRSAAVTAPLKRAVDGLSKGDPEKAIEMILELREAVKVEGKELETENLRATITSEVLSPETLLAILEGSNEIEEEHAKKYLKGVSGVLGCIQTQHADSVLAFLPNAKNADVRALLLDYLKRMGRGHEKKIAELFKLADVELGLELVRLLVEIDSDAAKDAVTLASQSPHALVRIEALGHLEGVSSVRLRAELRKLLEDDQESVRLAALEAMEKHDISVAGPFLVIRIQDKSFVKLPIGERRQALKTLTKLRPGRAEELCVEFLKQSTLFKGDALESTRAMAADMLADLASGPETFAVVEGVANGSRWKHSQQVREAAQRTLALLTERAEKQAERAAERAAQADARKTEARKKRKTRPAAATTAEGDQRGTQPGKRRRRRPSGTGQPAAGGRASGRTAGGET